MDRERVDSVTRFPSAIRAGEPEAMRAPGWRHFADEATGSRLEGYTDRKIAGRLDCGVCTVDRRLRTIRTVWGRRD
jgi:hypothetical protein